MNLNRPRPLRDCFAAPGSAAWEAAERQLHDEWLELVREQNHAQALRLLIPERVGPWSALLEPLALYRFGYWCHEQGAHEQAVLLLDQLVARKDGAELGACRA